MVGLFSTVRNAAFAALALGAGALLAPEAAQAQGRHGFSGGGARFAGAGFAGPRGGMAPRMAYGSRGVVGGYRTAGYRTAGYRTAGYRPGVRPPGWGPRPPGWGPRPPGWRPHWRHGSGWWGGGYYPYWPAAAGLGVGLIGAAAIANSGYYYADDAYYAPQCWLERRTVRTNYGRRVINVKVCPAY